MVQTKCDEDIVISGMSGRFPSSRNIEEFERNLYNEINMVNDDETRFKHTHPSIPKNSGKIPNISKFDATFFGVHQREANSMDPQVRILIEEAYKAIMDAGVNPFTLRGSNIGVYVGSSISETEQEMYQNIEEFKFGITGCRKAMFANRISYALDFTGPSLVCDTACSSSIYSLDLALRALQNGEIEAAVVGGANLCLHPVITLQFALLGVLSSNGICRPFDAESNGYTRSEAIGCIFLQRKSAAKRVYANIICSKVNCDGFKVEGITYPSSVVQERLLRQIYSKANVNLDEIGYIEAHCTATIVGDPEECKAIDNAICKQRSIPLAVGSVKSNCGHAEPAAGMCSLIKVLLTLNNGIIPPNINVKTTKQNIDALKTGRLAVVTTPTKLLKPFVGVNSFGFGGANAHVILKQFEKAKWKKESSCELPRLVLWSGRTVENTFGFLTKLENKPLDEEYLALIHSSQAGGIPGMNFRGFSILKSINAYSKPKLLNKEIHQNKGIKRPLVYVFSGLGSQWVGMGKSLMQIPMFNQSIQRSHSILKSIGVDLNKIIISNDPNTFKNMINSFVGTVAIQIALVDTLNELGVTPDFVIGHSLGELSCAYVDMCLTAEQVLLSAYYQGKISMDMSISKLSAGQELLKYLKQIIPNPNLHSNKWIITSVSKSKRLQNHTKLSSAEYHTNSLLSNGTFEESTTFIPMNAVTLEIAPDTSFQNLIGKAIAKSVYVGLIKYNTEDDVLFFFNGLGRLYANGIEILVNKIYPPLSFPVSLGTQCLSSQINFDHTIDHFVFRYKENGDGSSKHLFSIKLADSYQYLSGHEIDGRVLVPATFYLECVWRTFASMKRTLDIEVTPIEFENVKFERATTISSNTVTELTVIIHRGKGAFEVTESSSLVVTGTVRELIGKIKPISIVQKATGETVWVRKNDFYKELKLRGYHYNGDFKGVEMSLIDGSYGKVKWTQNWVSFMDCMLQMSIIGQDSRTLMLPTKLRSLRIYPQYHRSVLNNEDIAEVYLNTRLKRMVSAGVEIIGLDASAVQRRRIAEDPVLERYQFVPHFPAPKLNLIDIARCCIQIALENQSKSTLEVVELSSEKQDTQLLMSLVQAVEDLPLITGNYTLIHKVKNDFLIESDLTTVSQLYPDDDYESVSANILVIDSSSLNNAKDTIASAVIKNMDQYGFIVSRNSNGSIGSDFKSPEGFASIAYFPIESQTLAMFKRLKHPSSIAELKIFNIPCCTDFEWIGRLQRFCKSGGDDVVVVSQGDRLSGVLGLVNCLRKEPETKNIRCVHIIDAGARSFDLNLPVYAKQLELGLCINIYKNGNWGTYRHLILSEDNSLKPHTDHVYGNIRRIGDLSSLKWFQGPLTETNKEIQIMYSSLNFKDVMQASGRLPIAVFGKSRLGQTCIFGFEYSGLNMKTGKHIMGMTFQGAISSHLPKTPPLLWEVPRSWSLRDAATVPVVYLTVYYAYFFTTDIRKGKSILIHAGSGGVGLAAIRVAQAYGLEVFTTVSSTEKKAFLLKTFPALIESHIGNSRDTSFEEMVMRETQGNGVDFVLNSLSEDKLKASLRCLGRDGNFLEIGKFDMANDNDIDLGSFLNGTTFHSVLADNLLEADLEFIENITRHISKDIETGIIQPLPSTVYTADEIEHAFRYLMSGKHIGKVVIQVREEPKSDVTLPISVHPQVYFAPDLVYVVSGGLGGFGLELVDWMILRGARNLMLSSSRGISNDYQKLRIALWKSYSCIIAINTSDIGTKNGCLELLAEATKLGPVGGIFNLAVILRDSVFMNQTVEFFRQSFGPKAFATKYLDEISRQMCPKLHHFVIFSSVSCGRGNAGQTNYGMANSIMERIIEDRMANGLPGKAVQWGAIGEVGLVAEMAADKIDLEIGGTLQQRISSCLDVLDVLLSSPNPLVASMVVAEKKAQTAGQSPVEFVLNTMSIRDIKSVSLNSSLSELGMDSLMSVEIKQAFERDYEIVLNASDLRSLTIAKLVEMSENVASGNLTEQPSDLDPLEHLRQFYGQITSLGSPDIVMDRVNEVNKGIPIIILPGIDGGSGDVWQEIGRSLKSPAYVLQYHSVSGAKNISEIVEFAIKNICECMQACSVHEFQIIGYSMGALVTHLTVASLEEKGYRGKAILIDGSPLFIQRVVSSLQNIYLGIDLDKMILTTILSILLPDLPMQTIQRDFRYKLFKEDWFKYIYENLQKYQYSNIDEMMSSIEAIYQRLKIIQNSETYSTIRVVEAELLLLKPTVETVSKFDEFYGLTPFTRNEIQIEILEGNHQTILHNNQLPDIINIYFGKQC